MRLRGRVTRLEAVAEEARLYRLMTRQAAKLGRPVDSVWAEWRRHAVWFARDRLLHPVAATGDGRVDLEPQVRRLAAELGVDPDAAVAEAQWVLDEWGLT